MKKIGIDVRLWGTKHSGLGRYTEELVKGLQALNSSYEFILFCKKDDLALIPEKKNWRKVVANIKHYSIQEQITLPQIFNREDLDLLHVPHFNVPLFYKKPFISTVHDVLWHNTRGQNVTTLPAPVYLAKYFAYKAIVKNTVNNARRIIVPSNFVKSDLLTKFKIPAEKIIVTYEGVPERSMKYVVRSMNLEEKYKIKKPYLLYVGNLYPHKNVETIVKALKESKLKQQLVVICGRSVFWERFNNFIKQEKAENIVNLVGYVPDSELAEFYKNAEAFIFPTLSEGFGLPGLEAMTYGTPVLCSDIPVLKEVYAEAALYFDPKSIKSISGSINELISDKSLREKLIENGKVRIKQFSWNKMAKETLSVYKEVIKSE